MEQIAYQIVDLVLYPWNYLFTIYIDLGQAPHTSICLGDMILSFATFYMLVNMAFNLIGYYEDTHEEYYKN